MQAIWLSALFFTMVTIDTDDQVGNIIPTNRADSNFSLDQDPPDIESLVGRNYGYSWVVISSNDIHVPMESSNISFLEVGFVESYNVKS